MNADDSLPNDIEILKHLVRTREVELAQARAEASTARAEASNARAEASSAEALITHLRLTIEKLKRDLFGPRNERKARLIDQMELQLEELEAAASEDEIAAEKATAITQVRAFTRRKPAPLPLPAQLPREPIIVQRYLPEIRKGDKRIVLIDGVAAGGVTRVPAAGEASRVTSDAAPGSALCPLRPSARQKGSS